MRKLLLFYILLILSAANSFAQESPVETTLPDPPYNYKLEEMDSIMGIAIKYFYNGNYEKVVDQVPALIDNAGRLNSPNFQSKLRGLLGNAFIQIDEFAGAEALFNKQLDVAKKIKDTSEVLKSYNNLGIVYFYSDADKSISYFKQGLEYGKSSRSDDLSTIVTIINYNLSEIYLDNKQPDLAQSYLNLVKKRLYGVDVGVQSKEVSATINYVQSGIYLLKNEYEKSIEQSLLSLDKGIGTLDQNYLTNNYKNLIDAYDKLGEYEKLNEFRKPYDSLRDIRYEQEKIRQQQVSKIKFKITNVQKELEESKLENERVKQKAKEDDTLILVFAILGIALIGLSATLLYNRAKRNTLVKDLRLKNTQYLEAKETSEKLAKKNTKFLSTISHELRTPLYGIIGLSSVFLKNPKLKEFSDDFKSLKFSADYLLALVNDVLSINKYESKQGQELKEGFFNIKQLTNSILQTFEFLNEKNNNTVNLHIDVSLPQVLYGDQTKLSQVIMNLMSNASKFTQDGSIDFTILQHNNNGKFAEIFFEVRDSGRGIRIEDQNSIFEEFSQVPTDVYEGGTGLGLPITNKLLKILGSKLNMESDYGKGTAFSFMLLLPIGTQKDLLTVVEAADVQHLKGKKVLIVDDNKINQLVTQKVLEQYDMIHETANNGKEAVDMVTDNNYHFILMDINMPVMNGIEASGIIREMGVATPILALTAADDLNLEKDVYGHGINAILVKPYQTEQLLHLLLQYTL